MQHTIGGGTEQQSESVPAMATDHDHVDVLLVREPMDLGFGPTKDQVLAFRRNADRTGELGEMRLRLLVNLFLHRRKIHGNVPAIREAKRFDHVDDVKLRVETLCNRNRTSCNAVGFIRQIHGQQDPFVGTHVADLRGICSRPYTDSFGPTTGAPHHARYCAPPWALYQARYRAPLRALYQARYRAPLMALYQ